MRIFCGALGALSFIVCATKPGDPVTSGVLATCIVLALVSYALAHAFASTVNKATQ